MEILLGIQLKGAIIVKLRVNLSYITLMQTETSWSVVKISFFTLDYDECKSFILHSRTWRGGLEMMMKLGDKKVASWSSSELRIEFCMCCFLLHNDWLIYTCSFSWLALLSHVTAVCQIWFFARTGPCTAAGATADQAPPPPRHAAISLPDLNNCF